MPDQIIATILFFLGLMAAAIALLEPLAGVVLLVIRYLMKLWQGPFKTKKSDTDFTA